MTFVRKKLKLFSFYFKYSVIFVFSKGHDLKYPYVCFEDKIIGNTVKKAEK